MNGIAGKEQPTECALCDLEVIGMGVAPAEDPHIVGGVVDKRGTRHDGYRHQRWCPIPDLIAFARARS